MIRRTVFSLLAGIVFAILLAVTPTVRGACQGYCADRTMKNRCLSDFAGCTMHYDANGSLEHVDCFYVNTCPS